MSGEASGMPARNYSWPPFEKGNEAALRHGAYSTRRVEGRAREIAERLEDVVPGFNASHRVTVELLARELARIELADLWLEEHGILDERGQPQPILKVRSIWTNSAARLANDLALNPSAQAKLGLAAAQAKGVAASAYIAEKRARELEEEGST
jgi:hypothetical protein